MTEKNLKETNSAEPEIWKVTDQFGKNKRLLIVQSHQNLPDITAYFPDTGQIENWKRKVSSD